MIQHPPIRHAGYPFILISLIYSHTLRIFKEIERYMEGRIGEKVNSRMYPPHQKRQERTIMLKCKDDAAKCTRELALYVRSIPPLYTTICSSSHTPHTPTPTNRVTHARLVTFAVLTKTFRRPTHPSFFLLRGSHKVAALRKVTGHEATFFFFVRLIFFVLEKS